MLICYCFIDIDRRTKLLTCRKGVFPSWNSKKHEILVTIDSSYPPSPGGMMEKGGDYCTHCAPSQLKNTEVNTFKNALFKQSFESKLHLCSGRNITSTFKVLHCKHNLEKWPKSRVVMILYSCHSQENM